MLKNKTPLLLASQSPRRQQMLRQLGIEFKVVNVEIEELCRAGESPDDFVCRMAREKALAAAAAYPGEWILSADTIVVRDAEILGKPDSQEAAVRMLNSLSGRWHRVMTAFTLKNSVLKQEFTELDTSRVKLVRLDPLTIAAYVAGGEPLDKAGAYAVQGTGGAFVESLKGCPTTVVGLPLPLVVGRLVACGIVAPGGQPV